MLHCFRVDLRDQGGISVGPSRICYLITCSVVQNFQMLKSGVVQTPGCCGIPRVLQRDRTPHKFSPFCQGMAGWSGWRLFCCCPKPFDVLFLHTLERPLCHINQGGSECQAVFSVNPEAFCRHRRRFIGKKSSYICSCNLCARTSPADVS